MFTTNIGCSNLWQCINVFSLFLCVCVILNGIMHINIFVMFLSFGEHTCVYDIRISFLYNCSLFFFSFHMMKKSIPKYNQTINLPKEIDGVKNWANTKERYHWRVYLFFFPLSSINQLYFEQLPNIRSFYLCLSWCFTYVFHDFLFLKILKQSFITLVKMHANLGSAKLLF